VQKNGQPSVLESASFCSPFGALHDFAKTGVSPSERTGVLKWKRCFEIDDFAILSLRVCQFRHPGIVDFNEGKAKSGGVNETTPCSPITFIPDSEAYELPIQMPTKNTKTPPTIT
jgi:hypothetical protein